MDALRSDGASAVPLPGAIDDDTDELYENAPCGQVSTTPDGTIIKINNTLLGWLGYGREQVVGRRRFGERLPVGGRVFHETHLAPLLRLRGEINGIALELLTASGARLPV